MRIQTSAKCGPATVQDLSRPHRHLYPLWGKRYGRTETEIARMDSHYLDNWHFAATPRHVSYICRASELTFKYVQCTPLVAVAARFGIGRDFWINLPLTIAGYIPGSSFHRCYRLATHPDSSYEGHVHNLYVQVCNPLHFGWITTLPRHCD